MDSVYLHSLTGKLFKILPLREEHGDSGYLSYLDSLWMEMSGACSTFPDLWQDADYIAILNIIGYLNTHSVTVEQCKREVFKTIDLIKKVQAKNGGDTVE